MHGAGLHVEAVTPDPPSQCSRARGRPQIGKKKKRAVLLCQKNSPPPRWKIAHAAGRSFHLPWCAKSWDSTGRMLPNGNRNERTGTPFSSQCAALPRARAAPHCPVHSNVARGPAHRVQLFWSRARWGLKPGGQGQTGGAGLTMTGLVAGYHSTG